MNKIITVIFCMVLSIAIKAQNVGIGEVNPTHTLHVTPFTQGDDPIRVSGLNLSNPIADTSFVMFNNGDGVFKYIPFNNVINLIADSLSSSSTFVDLISDALLPAGEIHTFSTETPPSGYLECNGQAVSRTTFSRLFTAVGSKYGDGDGTTTFNLPDYRGQFLRGFDNTSGIDIDATTRTDRGDGTTGDAVGTKQTNATLAHNHTIDPPATSSNSTGDHLHTIDPPVTSSNTTGNHTHSIDPPNTTTTSNGNHTHTMPGYHLTNGGNQLPWYNWANSNMATNTNTTSTSGNHNHTINIPAFNSASSGNHTHSTDIALFNSSNAGNHTHTTDISQFNSGSDGGQETRPTNVSVLWCIKF